MEIQIVLAKLIGNFRFALPDGEDDIKWVLAGEVSMPILGSKPTAGAQVPLLVTPLQ